MPRDRRGARRLADVHAPLRLAARAGCSPAPPTRSQRPARCGAPTPRGRSRASRRAWSRRCAACPPTPSSPPTATSPPSRASRWPRCRSGRPRSSSARSRRTRTSTASPPPGAVSPRALPDGAARDRRAAARSRGRRRGSSRDLPGARRASRASLEPRGCRSMLDDATLLVLPSWPEGLGRVVIESFARGRGVVAHRRRRHPRPRRRRRRGHPGPAGRRGRAREALLRVLADRELARRLGAAARERYADWHSTPAEFAAHMRDLVAPRSPDRR